MTVKPPPIVVVGGGVAALEFLLALRALSGDLPPVTLVAPEDTPSVRPLQLLSWDPPVLSDLAPQLGAEFVRGSVAAVEPDRKRILLRAGGAVAYDTLVLSPGATAEPAFDGAVHLGLQHGAQLEALHEEIDRGDVARIAFVAPATTGWLVPAYDAALQSAGRGQAMTITVVTPERAPLESFGAQASDVVAAALAAAGVQFRSGQVRAVHPDRVELLDGGTVAADRVVSIPLVRGPRIDGVPATPPLGLIPVDPFGQVAGLQHVYAVGDATDFPVKQAALACAQADAAAEHIAVRHGHPGPPTPFDPQPRATLHDHRGEQLPLNGGQGVGKLPGRHLAPFLLEQLHAPA